MTGSDYPRDVRAGNRARRGRGRLLALAFLVVLAAGGFAPTGTMLLAPGQAVPLLDNITVDGLPSSGLSPGSAHQVSRGEVLLLTVEARQASVYRWLAAVLGFCPGQAVLPRRAIIPPGVSVEEHIAYGEEQMRENTGIASVLASRAAGELPVGMSAAGVRVAAVVDPEAQGVLAPGDLLTALDGVPVSFAGDIGRLLRGKRPGATVLLTIVRDGQPLSVRSGLRPAAAGGEEAMLGALIVTSEPVFVTPRTVVVDTTGIGGPSGGLAIALAVFEALTGEGLMAGKTVAASGYLRPDGSVGPIGGVRQKAIAASRAGAAIMFVAPANGDEARAGSTGMAVVEVSTFDEALAYMRSARLTPR
ncbi:MAG: S16 family serine protease [Bacillota bacterium]|nr:S16 family serine protease [Bacillota bacterium]